MKGKKMRSQLGFALTEILITLAVLFIAAAGGAVVWRTKVSPTPLPLETSTPTGLLSPTQLPAEDETLKKCLNHQSCERGYKCFYGFDQACPRGQDCSVLTFTEVGDNRCHRLCDSDLDCPKESRCLLKEAFKGDVVTVYDKLCVKE